MLRYAFGERFTQVRESKVVSGLEYPQFYLTLSKSFAGVQKGEYDFSKIEAKIDHRFRWRGFGKTIVCLQGGIATGKIPYPYLFNDKGTRVVGSVNNSVVINNYFQTMGLYEFVSDRYVYFFLNHHVGRLTSTENKTFRPELSIIQNIGYGELRNAVRHEGLPFKTLEKGYFESGLVITNLVRFSYVNLIYIGLGGGVFYRYGHNAVEKESDNYAYKLALTFSF